MINFNYEKAIRFYLDNMLDQSLQETFPDEYEMNAVKPFKNYIKKRAPKDFKFSRPMFAWWNLTSACNLRCIHCLYNKSEYSNQNDLNENEAYRLAEELIEDFGIVEIALTGGEIFLRKDLLKLIEIFKRNNVAVKLMTNGTLIKDNDIEILSKLLNPYTDSVQISLDGANEKTYEKIRLTKDFSKVISNIKKLTDANIRVIVAQTVNKINLNETIDLYKLCNSLNVKDFISGRMLYYNETHTPLMVEDKEYFRLAYELLTNKLANTSIKIGFFKPIDLLNNPDVEKILKEKKYQQLLEHYKTPLPRSCNINDKIFIQSDGKIYMCLEAICKEALMGEYRKNSLLEIWQQRNSNIFFQPRTICKNCKYNVICNSGCMAKAFKKYGDINKPEKKCKYFMVN